MLNKMHRFCCVGTQECAGTVHYRSVISAILALVIISVLPLCDFMPKGHWHDQQRLGQIVVFVIAVLVLVSTPSKETIFLEEGSPIRFLIVALLIAGSISALFARHVLWGFAEVGIVLGSLGIAGMVVILRQSLRRALDSMIIGALFFICTALTLQFLVAYLAVVVTGSGEINPAFLLDGFSNPRFYGQFVSLSLPILAIPMLVSSGLRRFYLPAAIILCLWWAISFTTGTRGTWLGMMVAAAILFFLGGGGRSWVKVHFFGALVGLALCFLWLNWLPSQFGLSVANSPVARLTTSLSLREVIWRQAIEMAMARPLLGFGPMHFADIPNAVAAHPHQALLQWSCEWGLPSAMVVAYLVLRALYSVMRVVLERGQSRREIDMLRICLLAAVVASLTQSMVDGVLVMPYTEIWLALIGGWLFAIHQRSNGMSKSGTKKLWWEYIWHVSLIMSVMLLVFVSVRDFSLLHIREERYSELFGGHLKPRFWAQGMIHDDKL